MFLVPATASTKSLGLTGDASSGNADESGVVKGGSVGPGASPLEDMWQVVGLRKPVLFIANKASNVQVAKDLEL